MSSDDNSIFFKTNKSNGKLPSLPCNSVAPPSSTHDSTPPPSPRKTTPRKKLALQSNLNDKNDINKATEEPVKPVNPQVAKLSKRSPSPVSDNPSWSDSSSLPDLSDSQIPDSPSDLFIEESPKVGSLLSMWENKADKRPSKKTRKTK